MAGFEKTAKTSRAGRFPPPCRGPRRRSRLGLLAALDAARRPSPPRPQRGPRRRRRPFLRQSRDRRPCLHDLASSTAVRQLGFVAQTKPAIHRCLRPRSRSGRHSCRPARAPVPAALHRRPPHGPSATAPPRQLSVDTRRPCTCNQRPSARSHRSVDNSLITSRIEYSTFLNLPLDECIVNTPQMKQKRTKREAKTEKNREEGELEQVTKARKKQEQVT